MVICYNNRDLYDHIAIRYVMGICHNNNIELIVILVCKVFSKCSIYEQMKLAIEEGILCIFFKPFGLFFSMFFYLSLKVLVTGPVLKYIKTEPINVVLQYWIICHQIVLGMLGVPSSVIK